MEQISPRTPGQKRRGFRVLQILQTISFSISVLEKPYGFCEGREMARTSLFFKVEVEHDPKESPERLGAEIERQLRKLYSVRYVELASLTRDDDN